MVAPLNVRMNITVTYKFVKFFRNEDVINSGSVICRSAVHLSVPAGEGHLPVSVEDPKGVQELVLLHLHPLHLPVLLLSLVKGIIVALAGLLFEGGVYLRIRSNMSFKMSCFL